MRQSIRTYPTNVFLSSKYMLVARYPARCVAILENIRQPATLCIFLTFWKISS